MDQDDGRLRAAIEMRDCLVRPLLPPVTSDSLRPTCPGSWETRATDGQFPEGERVVTDRTPRDGSQLSDDWFPLRVSPTPTYVRHETTRRLRRMGLQTGEDIRRMRLDAGVSLSELGRAVSVDRRHVGRIEAGAARPSVEVLISIGVALGADLSMRYFAGAGPRLHDRFQAPMIECVIREIDARWRPEVEVPITHPARGVIDLVLHEDDAHVSVSSEAYSDLQRLEQQLRWSAEKADGLKQRLGEGNSDPSRQVSRLLILRSTVRTRELARLYRSTLEAAYPARTRDVVLALTTPLSPWPGAGIVWVHLHGRKATLMRLPPPGIELGR